MAMLTKPDAFTISETPEAIHVRWRNRNLYHWLGAIIFYVILAVFAPLMVVLLVSNDGPGGKLAVVLWLYGAYKALSGALNGISIAFDARSLSVADGPFPWTRTQRLPSGNIERFDVRSRSSTVGSERRMYYLTAVMKKGGAVELLGGFPVRSVADYLRELLEARRARQ